MSAPELPAAPAEPKTGEFEGAGLVSSWVDVGAAIESGGPFQIAFAAAGLGLDALGFIANPFDALIQAGVGWAMEHFPFLREPLDMLAGRPGEIVELAKSWHQISLVLADVAAQRRQPPPPMVRVGDAAGRDSLSGWDGAAGRAYQLAAEAQAAAIATVAVKADDLAAALVTAGASIGTVRALVRDMIAAFIGKAIGTLLLGVAVATGTAGVTLAASISYVVLEAIDLARRIAERVSTLLSTLAETGGAVGQLAAAMRSAGNAVGTGALHTYYGGQILGQNLHRAAQPVDEVLGNVVPLVEQGKQTTGAQNTAYGA